MRLVDTHSHIHDAGFGDDAAAAVARARDARVVCIVTLGVNLDDSRLAVGLAEKHDGVLAAAGVHPHDAKDATDAALDDLEDLVRHPKVVLVGEIGLDFYRNLSPRDAQIAVLRRQLATAQRTQKPVAVHARDSDDTILPILTDWSRQIGGRLPDGRPAGVMHYFSGDAALAREYVRLGFVISIHTSVTHPTAARLQQVARDLPLEHLVLETDSPYGAPQRFRGGRNEPAHVAEAAAKIAELRGESVERAAERTTRTALALFGMPEDS